MRRTTEYTIVGPPRDPAGQSPPSASKSLPIRRDSKNLSANLRSLYRISAQPGTESPPFQQQSQPPLSAALPTSPQLPPTPPGASHGEIPTATTAEEATSDAMFRSALVTPINQNSPPTPDNTPPRERKLSFARPFLGTQPSIASTRTESFTTAQEDLFSESESDVRSLHNERGFDLPTSTVNKFGAVPPRNRHNKLGRSPLINAYDQDISQSRGSEQLLHDELKEVDNSNPLVSASNIGSSPVPISARSLSQSPANKLPISIHKSEPKASGQQMSHTDAAHDGVKRGRSLRDRLLEAQIQDPSASTERFANIIGWNNSVPIIDSPDVARQAIDENRRFSGISTASTIEAYVFEHSSLPKRASTLRHVNKHESLRSVSSPLPTSNRNSMHSNSESPHRLVHKKARLSNQNRWSFGSEVSRSYSLASSAVLPKTEIIRVAVIPERSSSLSSSANSSKRESLSTESKTSHSRKASDPPPTSWHHKRAFSEALDRGRQQQPPPVIPVRASSLSAPTSRTTSRANSITSEHLRVRRQQAETDLRKTLDRMESERLVQNLEEWNLGEQRTSVDSKTANRQPRKSTDAAQYNALGLVVPGSTEWAALRPPSVLDTPFSQPSFQSASPEINEARAINLFPHNNHSLQLIEPFPVQESKAVLEVQRRNLPQVEVDSPLRNPRRPPEPPQFKVIPPTPGDEHDQRFDFDATHVNGRVGSLRRPRGTRQRSESFINSISRNLSLKNARNRKADQDLDSNLHPFWRPRAFWDDIDNARTELPEEQSASRGIVNNSLGLPQERTVINGPASLIRRISERRRQKTGVERQSSHGSLAKIRATRRLHKSSGHGLRLHFVSLRGIHRRLLYAKQRKEDEKRERRRAMLRKSIGANVISQGDSRFPASNTSLSRDM
ncbi:uncharacterized protein A1O9_06783 [Exophiala aquamarina CBS 119918]|uniref:Uncharacterized protein n=1 Tax=Exophiala aquamarina CBS 119918 TaxID=1182545 RepID=A0A072P8Z2_9EURO|nr:uncharacterized protein A1O9_06783 [Exophiala aquamarina CBS 119918]KEF56594.1 hypothetical protein A1O9_06783 [Exophiala aquamarina CBS 119918]